MSQASVILQNVTRTQFRQDLNAANQAMASNFAGTDEPANPFARQFWFDETAGFLKIRNASNTAWERASPPAQTQGVWNAGAAQVESTISPEKLSAAIANQLNTASGRTEEVDLSNGGLNDLTHYAFTGLPSGISKMRLVINKFSYSGADNPLIQLSAGGVFVELGYEDSTSGDVSKQFSSGAGFVVSLNNAVSRFSGWMDFAKGPGANVWTTTHIFRSATGAGRISLSGEVDGVKINSTGSNTIDSPATAWLEFS